MIVLCQHSALLHLTLCSSTLELAYDRGCYQTAVGVADLGRLPTGILSSTR